MFVSNLFKMQKKLDEKLCINPDLDEYKIKARKNLELHIKVSDLANETNCYEYTKNMNNIVNCDVILSKYVDCLKQVLSVGITNGYDNVREISIQPNEYCLSDQFLNLYIDINDLIISRSEDHFKTLFEDFLSIGYTLGFSEQQILDSFENTTK
ncbi:dUTP diphosphatase [Eubacterium multiforme]|uniref:Dimeric dUTPase (All-alpha-NTP-PPase superfamily) n=1 Tax=Eubacterium multiforme TaxID=83339 RepID=A0ABT9UY70_9FIRM|nr:dUTP diphosphatase [Eubacterium multiforme]MDQ0151267.1 dimeric dUTPase (all-alpha-NTP-PPase superfamily) [Eubacterium multiforme]